MEAAKRGATSEAYRRLDQAESILDATDGVLRVELSGPTTRGGLNLWEWVMRTARHEFHTTAGEVIALVNKAEIEKL